MRGHTIGQLAKAVGVPTSTIRFYAREGLCQPDARSGGNYRLYSDHAVERLRFVRSAQASGFSLDDIRAMLGLVPTDASTCDEVIALTRNRLADVRQRIDDLKRIERRLAASLSQCCRSDRDVCTTLIRLKAPQRAKSSKKRYPRLDLTPGCKL